MNTITRWKTASIATAVSQVVESLAAGQVSRQRPDQSKRIFVTSYSEDFTYLWACPEAMREWLALNDRHIIVVWDGIPDPEKLGEYNVTDYVTPVDWSVMMTLAVEYVPRITIVDFASQHRQGSRTLQMFRHLCRSRPSSLPHIREVNLPELKQFFSDLSFDAMAIQPTPEDRSVIRVLWNALFSEGKGAHHAVANIVGPLILLEAMGGLAPSSSSIVAPALRQLIRVLQGSKKKDTINVGGNSDQHDPWFDFNGNLGPFVDSVVLTDDLAQNGWGDVLRAMLGLSTDDPRVRVYLRPMRGESERVSTFLDFPSYLRRRLDWPRFSAGTNPPSLLPGVKNPLVFLDIRLFSQSSVEVERGFYKSLLALALEFRTLPRQGWPVDLSDATLGAVQRFTEGQADLESADHHAALSLLPRLVALADHTLPIILFSSTGRRVIVEPLIPCGSVIFDFEKPSLTAGDWDETVERVKSGFKRAMERVVPLLRTRSFLQELSHTDPKVKTLLRDSAETNFHRAEIYVDESGSDDPKIRLPVFSVGGVVIFYPNSESCSQLDDLLKEKSLLWGLAEGHAPLDSKEAIPDNVIPKYPGGERWRPGGYTQFLNRLDECFTDLSLRLAAFALVWRPNLSQMPMDLPEPLRENVIDNRYRRMIEEALEAVLYCTLPAHCPSGTEITVDCATRQRNPEPPYDPDRLQRDFGIGISKNSGKYYVLSSDSVYSIVGRLLSSWPSQSPNVRRARGTTLYEFERLQEFARKNIKGYEEVVNDRKRPRPQQIHYLADWFARFGMHAPSLPNSGLVRGAFKNGFLESRDEQFAGWLRAARAGADGRITDALFEVWMATKHKAPMWSIARWLRRRAADWVGMIDGPSFIELATRINARTGQREPDEKQSV